MNLDRGTAEYILLDYETQREAHRKTGGACVALFLLCLTYSASQVSGDWWGVVFAVAATLFLFGLVGAVAHTKLTDKMYSARIQAVQEFLVEDDFRISVGRDQSLEDG